MQSTTFVSRTIRVHGSGGRFAIDEIAVEMNSNNEHDIIVPDYYVSDYFERLDDCLNAAKEKLHELNQKAVAECRQWLIENVTPLF